MTPFDQALFDRLLQDAAASPRRRAHHLLHRDHADPVQRMCVAMQRGSYVRPHQHPRQDKWELLVVLQGSLAVLLFDSDGQVVERLELRPGAGVAGLEIEAGRWHALVALTDSALFLEAKAGPFVPFDPSDFAAWAPPEGDPQAFECLTWMGSAKVGDRFGGAAG